MIAFLGISVVPVYFLRCFNAIVIEPECFKLSGKERVFTEVDTLAVPDWSHDVIVEIWEAFREQQKSRRWSD